MEKFILIIQLLHQFGFGHQILKHKMIFKWLFKSLDLKMITIFVSDLSKFCNHAFIMIRFIF
jgi:hypothetical protein